MSWEMLEKVWRTVNTVFNKSKEEDIPVLKHRPRCSMCHVEHTINCRVAWWDSYGISYGEQAPEGERVRKPLCDECAPKLFALRREAQEMLALKSLGPLTKGEFRMFLERVEKSKEVKALSVQERDTLHGKLQRLMGEFAVLLTLHSAMVGMLSYTVSTTNDGSGVVLTINEMFIQKNARALSGGTMMFCELMRSLSDRVIHCIKFNESISKEASDFLTTNFLSPLDQTLFAGSYEVRGEFLNANGETANTEEG